MTASLRTHDTRLVDGDLVLRPLVASDLDDVLGWVADPRVMWSAEDDREAVWTRDSLEHVYTTISATADLFLIEVDGTPVGDGWVRAMNRPDIAAGFLDRELRRVDLSLRPDCWGRGWGTRAVRALTGHAFAAGADLVVAVDVWDFDAARLGAFARSGYVPWRRVRQPAGAEGAWTWRLVCRPGVFDGSAPAQDHPSETWPMAADLPHGSTVVVYRRRPDGVQVLLLHRALVTDDGPADWAWTPPAGARMPAEPVDEGAARELHEEAGIDVAPGDLRRHESSERWAVFSLEVPAEQEVQLDPEHDRFEWVAPETAHGRCRPMVVADAVRDALADVGPADD